MARGKIRIKRIENSTNRQVTYSKRRNGLFKKANELSVLCDAKVSVIILSGTGKLHEYTSDSTSTKEIIDIYQRALRTDIWSSQYEKMQEHLKKLKEKNRSLRMQISRRMGECLNGLDFKELYELEQEMQDAVNNIRERKYKVLSNQIDTTNKKFKRAKQNINYLTDGMKDDPDYGLVEGPGGHYDSTAAAYPNGIPGILALGLQLNHPNILHEPKSESVITTWGVPKF